MRFDFNGLRGLIWSGWGGPLRTISHFLSLSDVFRARVDESFIMQG